MVMPVAFHFTVSFAPLPSASEIDCEFQEVTGIGAELELETVHEGGENRYLLQLPKGTRSGRLTLKRGVAELSSPLIKWCREVLEGGLAQRIETREVHVYLLDAEHAPLRAWSFGHAFPAKWSVDGLDAKRNELALESIELSYLTCKHTAVSAGAS
jgi:phage tail-like protein